MVYTSLKFESEEAARSQVERLQNQQRPIFRCHGGQLLPVQGAELGGTIATVQNMEVSSLCNSQSDPQCLELVTGARASVASCLNTIGCNVVYFTRLFL